MDIKQIILSSLSFGPITLADIHKENPNIPLDDLQTSAWYLVNSKQVSLDENFKLSLVETKEDIYEDDRVTNRYIEGCL